MSKTKDNIEIEKVAKMELHLKVLELLRKLIDEEENKEYKAAMILVMAKVMTMKL